MKRTEKQFRPSPGISDPFWPCLNSFCQIFLCPASLGNFGRILYWIDSFFSFLAALPQGQNDDVFLILDVLARNRFENWIVGPQSEDTQSLFCPFQNNQTWPAKVIGNYWPCSVLSFNVPLREFFVPLCKNNQLKVRAQSPFNLWMGTIEKFVSWTK